MAVFRSNSLIGGKPHIGSVVDWMHPLAMGLRFMTLLNEGDGPPFDLVGRSPGTLVSSTTPPSWTSTSSGLALTGTLTTDYYWWTPAYPMVGVWPFSMATLAANRQTSLGRATICFGNTGLSNPFSALRYNNSGDGVVGYSIRDDSGNNQALATAVSSYADGNMHVLQAISFGPTDHRTYWDGVPLTTGSTNVSGTFTINSLALGVIKTTAVTSPFLDDIAWAGVWAGGCPDPAIVAECLLNGDYPVRGGRLDIPRRVTYYYSSPASSFSPWLYMPEEEPYG